MAHLPAPLPTHPAMSDPLPPPGTPPPPADGATPPAPQDAPPSAAPPAPQDAPSPAATNPPQESPGSWSQVCRLLSLTSLDDIDPEKVRNSTAFKLGALAGLLPALSLVSLRQFLAPDQTGMLPAGHDSVSFLSSAGVLLSSALVGGAVAFFWAENRLRTIFTYGVAGPTVVLSMYLSGVGNEATKQQLQNVQAANAQVLADTTKKIQDEATQSSKEATQKIVNFTKLDMSSNVHSAPTSGLPAAANPAANPDLAPP